MMATAEAALLLDEAFTYPEKSSFFCPVRTRARLLGLLEGGSPLVYRRNGLIIWLSAGGHFVLYASRTPELLLEHAAPALEVLGPMARGEGAVLGNVYATSAVARQAFLDTGFRLDDALQRMRHDNPTASELDARVRRLQPADVQALAEVGGRSFPEQDWTPALWAQPIQNAERTWVALSDGRPAGFLLSGEMEHFTLITGLAVDPDCQGQGLGKALIRAEVAAAAASGFRGVEVHANDRPQALATYERCGFHIMHPAWALTRWW